MHRAVSPRNQSDTGDDTVSDDSGGDDIVLDDSAGDDIISDDSGMFDYSLVCLFFPL